MAWAVQGTRLSVKQIHQCSTKARRVFVQWWNLPMYSFVSVHTFDTVHLSSFRKKKKMRVLLGAFI